uniref:hypothetical protein n=1 Tax=Bacillus marinisedimentorum TaxID=1821260 RepID=UPI001B807ABD
KIEVIHLNGESYRIKNRRTILGSKFEPDVKSFKKLSACLDLLDFSRPSFNLPAPPVFDSL